jgi:hypothetical protein
VTGVTGDACFPDDDNGFLYTYKAGTGSTVGIRKFLSGGTSAEVTNANKADLGLIGASRGLSDNVGGSALMDASKHMYFTTWFSNTSELGKFNSALSTVNGLIGVASGDTPPGLGPFAVYSLGTTKTNDGTTYLMSSTTINTFQITMMAGDPVFALIGGSQSLVGAIASSRAVICGGSPKSSHAVAYILDKPVYGAAATTAWRLHKVTIANGSNMISPGPTVGVAFTFLKSIAPTDIDATWTNFSGGGGMAFDSTDGNVLAFFVTNDAVANQRYLVKLSTFDGSVVWKTAVGSVDAFADQNMNKHRIVNSRFLYLSGTTLSIFNTTDGSVTTQAYGGVSLLGGQISDDKYDGTLTFFGSYNHLAGTATPLGTYMIANLDATSQWLRVYAGFQAGVTLPFAINVYRAPALFGFGYTSQAQLLRPDYGQDAGAQSGPAFGKLRRPHQYAMATYRTRAIDIGTEFGKLRPINFRSEGGTDIAMPTLNTGTWAGGLEGRDDFEGKIAWQQDRPFPGVILAVAGYLQTSEK